MALYPIVILSLFAACAACALSLAVSLRVKKLLDPLIEEGAFKNDRPPTVPIGTEVPGYGKLTDVNGDTVELATGSGDSWILAFLSTTCSGCKAQLPVYREYLKRQDVSPDRLITVVSGAAADLGMYTAEIGEMSRVVHADDSSTIGSDLNVYIWPTYLLVNSERAVEFSTTSISSLPELVTRGTKALATP
ncbi:TlpA family protein disulfide reductase [Streptomyces sp. NPDC056244]|uniref:TlpA family protein disulfide reductase n=1 Tax=Streptomyces sp. NPDC056244 TaxID=3345762 RepID=UPI0035DF868C